MLRLPVDYKGRCFYEFLSADCTAQSWRCYYERPKWAKIPITGNNYNGGMLFDMDNSPLQ